MTVLPPGPPAMGGQLAQWFVYCLVVSLFAGYVASRALGPGAAYLDVSQFASTTAFCGYGLALWQNTIWYTALEDDPEVHVRQPVLRLSHRRDLRMAVATIADPLHCVLAGARTVCSAGPDAGAAAAVRRLREVDHRAAGGDDPRRRDGARPGGGVPSANRDIRPGWPGHQCVHRAQSAGHGRSRGARPRTGLREGARPAPRHSRRREGQLRHGGAPDDGPVELLFAMLMPARDSAVIEQLKKSRRRHHRQD